MIRKTIIVVCLGLLATTAAFANNKEQRRLENSGVVMQEIMNVPDDLPKDVMERAKCVIVFPSVLKAAFVVGASYGRGAMVCRTGKDFHGRWGSPAMYALEGGSVGFQIGASETDIVLLVMNDGGMRHLLSDKFTVGGDASAAAGPIGREATAQTDAMMNAEMLSYSRSRGLFAGISLEGATLRPDEEANHELYARDSTNREILTGDFKTPAAAAKFERALHRDSSRREQ